MRFNLLLALAATLSAQTSRPAIPNVSALPAHCRPTTSPNVVFLTTGSVGLYACTSTDHWATTASAGVSTLTTDGLNPGATVTCSGSGTGDCEVGADATILATQGGTNNFSATGNSFNGRYDAPCVNDSTGTTNGLLVKYTSSATCAKTATTDTAGAAGVVAVGGGTSGNARVTFAGPVAAIADATVTAGHYAVIGSTTAGRVGDSASRPAAGVEIVGHWLTSGAAGTSQTLFVAPDPNAGTSTSPTREIGWAFDGGGSALTTSAVGYITVKFSCTILSWSATVDTGTVTFDVWKIAAGTAIPTVANSIVAAAPPAVASGTAATSTALTGWSTAVSKNDVFGLKVSAVSGATVASVALECQ